MIEMENVPLRNYCSYRIGGRAKYLAEVFDTDGLLRAMELSQNRIVIGRGSKILFGDGGFDGTVIVMKTGKIRFDGGGVYAEAGVSLPKLSRTCAARNLSGLEWACGIPASVGGAIKMNAGAFKGDMSQLVDYVDVLRLGKTVRIGRDECGFGYRRSGFLPEDIVLGAFLGLGQGGSAEIKAKADEFAAKRTNAQPKGYSCGSVFKAAEKPAWQYIDGCGFKGIRSGGAIISEKHANFILNRGDAKARDVLALIRAIKAEVFISYGAKLQEEVIFAGEF